MRGSILLEHGLQLRQTLDRRASPRPLVCRYHNLLFVALLILHCCRHRYDLCVKEPRLLGCKRLVVRVHRHLILLGTGDLPLLRHVLRSDTHGCHARGSHLVGGELLGELVHVHPRGHVVHRHGLNPSSQPHIDDASPDVCCDVGNSLQSAAALSVDGRQGHIEGNIAKELRHTGSDCPAAWLEYIPNLDVSNCLGVDLGLLHNGFVEWREHIFARCVLKAAFSTFRDSRSYRTTDHHVIVRLRSFTHR
mmetsp:Transcript_53442/g.142987  ORF Transcript_53442/g.142987 Transcript_53442/m.142987 type:complete len:249 (-) Transcript_53442:146-892(-)